METKIIQFTAARGPLECAWVVAKVLKIFLKELERLAVGYEILQKENGTENGTVQSVVLRLEGKSLATFLESWLGTIQWIGHSRYRKYHKRKNWFIGCFEIEQLNMINMQQHDIVFQAVRSPGAGGQHVNKVSSAIRARHTPTGVQVFVSESRSQHQNKKIAIERLTAKVLLANQEQLKEQVQDQWNNHWNLERGNPVRTFEGSDFKPKTKKVYKTKRNQLKRDLQKQVKYNEHISK